MILVDDDDVFREYDWIVEETYINGRPMTVSCSKCKYQFRWMDLLHVGENHLPPAFCPHCGVRMYTKVS